MQVGQKIVNTLNSDQIRVLYAEDSLDDYELVISLIKRSGLNVLSRRVENPLDFKEAIKNEDWHLVISDNNLPQFNAEEALKITKEYQPYLPFIIVSGTMGEEKAVEAMRMGADDYILKDNLSRLIPAINRELQDYKNQIRMERTQMLLAMSRENYQLLAQNVQDLVCVHDHEGMYSWVSPSSERMLGYTPKELSSISPFSIIHQEDVEEAKQLLLKMQAGNVKTLQRFKYRMLRKDGIYIYLETLAEPIFKDGKLFKIVSTSRDITEQELSYKLLEENEAKYESVLESLSEGIVLVDLEERVLTYNQSAKEYLMLDVQDGRKFSDIVLENFILFDSNKKRIDNHNFLTVETLKNQGDPVYNKVYRFRNQEDECWFSFNCVPYKLDQKQLGAVISFKNVTDSFETKKKLNRLAQELVKLIETANAPIFGISKNGAITEWNNFSSDITGYSKSEVIGKNIYSDLIVPEDHEKVREFISKIFKDNISTNCELSLVTKSGKVITILLSGNIQRDFNGNISGIVCVCQDITELIEYREQLEFKVEQRTKKLKTALAKEKELVKLKSKFVSMASHEFRTPLSSIKFASDFIKNYHDKVSWEKINEKLKKIDDQVNNMTYLLDDVLIMGKSESGNINVEYRKLDVKSFCENLIEEVQNTFNNSHEIVFDFCAVSNYIESDVKLLRNILTNVLSNAIKFSPDRDRVKFSVLVKNDLLILTIEDKGIGIPKRDHTKIFDAFHRSAEVTAIHGTGLGLSIMKKAVELLNGTIDFESEIDKGTKFIIKIPLVNEEDSNS
ncbi:MAG: PAS domain S-box protein [Fulvivirga sp.]|uniref:hybrid sensor histidine kinase/response regulator n=1 Tax=Fulvivirga sp. TaxID=1931237 RepID=UPI0032EBF6EA